MLKSLLFSFLFGFENISRNSSVCVVCVCVCVRVTAVQTLSMLHPSSFSLSRLPSLSLCIPVSTFGMWRSRRPSPSWTDSRGGSRRENLGETAGQLKLLISEGKGRRELVWRTGGGVSGAPAAAAAATSERARSFPLSLRRRRTGGRTSVLHRGSMHLLSVFLFLLLDWRQWFVDANFKPMCRTALRISASFS